ncbi:MAG: TRAP transporter small permease subunit [Sphingomonadales bacterium]|jgi:TRAP-type mannitol/chloroaromatic compound transport system permease small subunit
MAEHRVVQAIEGFNHLLGRVAGWAALALILLQFLAVVLVYIFRADQIGLTGFSLSVVQVQELLLYINAFIFLGGAGAALADDAHVRVDIFYGRAKQPERDESDIIGTLVFLIPFCALVWWACLPFVWRSWEIFEGSIDSSGLPFIYVLKGFLLLFALTLSLQSIALIIRAITRNAQAEQSS